MPEEETSEEIEITILDRSDVTTYPTLEKEVVVTSTTFTGPNIPPLTIRIPKEEWTEEKEAEEMGKAIKEYKARKPEVKKITL